MKVVGLFFSAFLVSITAQAVSEPSNGPSAAQMEVMVEANKQAADKNFWSPFSPQGLVQSFSIPAKRPYAEYNTAGYLLFSDPVSYGSLWSLEAAAAKKAMWKNLPEGVRLVVFTDSMMPGRVDRIRDYFEVEPGDQRFSVIRIPTAGVNFWSRDAVPVPVWSTSSLVSGMSVVDARYYHHFEPDEEIANLFYSEWSQHDYFFEGGNFVTNALGDCVVVNNPSTVEMPDALFNTLYGCRDLTRLPYYHGIGHADEVIRFMSDTQILTVDEEYADIMKEKGFEVQVLPRPEHGSFTTYANSLILNGTVFLPVYGKKKEVKPGSFEKPYEQDLDLYTLSNNDLLAITIYESYGLKVVPVYSSKLSEIGKGSVHCITMTYPPVPFRQVLEQTDGELLTH